MPRRARIVPPNVPLHLIQRGNNRQACFLRLLFEFVELSTYRSSLDNMNWLTLVISLPTENATPRMRAWRAIKSAGAAALRDGVYLTPALEPCRAALRGVADHVRANGGSAQLLSTEAEDAANDKALSALFDRSAEFSALRDELAGLRRSFSTTDPIITQKPLRRLRKSFEQLVAIDFFPGEAQRQVASSLAALEARLERALSPDEPQPRGESVDPLPRLDPADFRKRLWATRTRPKVDRLASAWLIRRCIDPKARFVWLDKPADCPPDALGFDFDGAPFTHVGDRVTFETLAECFGLESPALARIGAIVHYLDVGGIAPAEAAGVATVLTGLRETMADDDTLLRAASAVFDGLFAACSMESSDD